MHLARITLFPIKSLDGIEVNDTRVLPSGSLKNDRQFAMVDAEGNFINGKRNARVHLLRARYHLDELTVTLQHDDEKEVTFSLDGNRSELECHLSRFFGQPVMLIENHETGFPDDTESPGPTIISTATLREIASWFPDMTVDETRRRFRTNLEIDGVEAFGEDVLFGETDEIVRFRIGELLLEGINPCARCVVPSRAAETGKPTSGFQKQFAERRRATFPQLVSTSRFDHFYRVAVNTRPVTKKDKTSDDRHVDKIAHATLDTTESSDLTRLQKGDIVEVIGSEKDK